MTARCKANGYERSDKGGGGVLQSERIRTAVKAVEACCGGCEVCSPDCPVAIAKRALTGLLYEVEAWEERESETAPPGS